MLYQCFRRRGDCGQVVIMSSSGQRSRLLFRWSEFESRWATNLCEKIVFGMDEITEMASVGPFYKKTKIIQKLNYIFDSLGKKLFLTLSSSHTNRKGWKEKGAPTFIHSMVKCQPWTDPINEISVVKICNACLFKAFWVNEKCWTANQNA